MAHFYDQDLTRPKSFNFAVNVVDYWAAKTPPLQAMYWISQDGKDREDLSYAHFERQSHRIAVLLKETGVRSGEKVLMILPRLPAWWELAVACLRSGVVVCPATTLLVAKDIEFRCQRSQASVYVGDSSSVQKFLKIRASCPRVRTVIQVGGDPPQGVIELSAALEEAVPRDAIFRGPKPDMCSPALIYFTSGTTGHPKMVQHDHISYPLAHTITGKHWLRLSPGKLYWNLSEQGWAKAAWSFFGTWNCGASLFVHDDRQSFSPTRLLDILHQYPITTLCAPPTAYRQLVLGESQEYFRKTPPQALSHCSGAGEPLNGEVIRLWKDMSGMQICDGYGQTETILICGNFEGADIRPGSMGRPSPGVPLHVVDSKGEECSEGVEGDMAVLVKSEEQDEGDFFGLFQGYLGPNGSLDKRVRTFVGSRHAAPKSWYLTGDRATRDKDGYFWFVGRADDVINSAGYRIGPFEVESTLKQHPAVVESAVVSSPDSSRGEVVKAFIVLTKQYVQRDADLLVKELQDFCKKNAAPYKYPRKIQFVDATFLPKTISGKIKRNELKRLEWTSSASKL
ncbi:hypothetical protein BJ546DRAFT_324187 [Cryomyces antarcticus]